MGIPVAIAIAVGAPSVAQADEAANGVVLVVGHPLGRHTVRDARRAVGGAVWRGETLTPAGLAAEEPPLDAIAKLRERYVDAEFSACLEDAGAASLDLTRLLARRWRAEAAVVAVTAAACAHADGDAVRAVELIDRAFALELDLGALLAETRPDFQALAERERRAVSTAPRVRVEIHTTPPEASVSVDGVERCERTPCALAVLPGTHVVTIERVGSVRIVAPLLLREDTSTHWPLHAAAPEEIRRQVAAALAAGTSPGDPGLLRAAAAAWGADVLAIAWTEGNNAHAHVFDRRGDRVASRVSVEAGDAAIDLALRLALRSYADRGPPPIYERPWFWVTVGVGAAVLGYAAYWLLHDPGTEHAVAF